MKHPNKFLSILRGKCPRCRRGDMYTQKGVWPLKTMLSMPVECAYCGQKMELETGFYFGTGYISYALSVAYMISFFVAYSILIGLSFRDNSVIQCLIFCILSLILIQPLMMRLSRVIYLYIFVKYDSTYGSR
jgi:uncharacterized protein (DUF983 family)